MINKTIGITGGIGSGKSVVSRTLRCNGMPVFDCDYEAKLLMKFDSEVKSSLLEKFGEDVYLPSGEINRRFLSDLLFSDKDALLFVNRVVHAAVRNKIKQCRNKIKGLFFIESAILGSGGLGPMCDYVWIVSAPIAIRIKRVEQRDGLSKEEILKRVDSQKNEADLLRSSNVTNIQNDDMHPVLPFILSSINKFNINQIFSLTC